MTKAKEYHLKKKRTIKMVFKKPFSFERTFYHPSHFESGLELFRHSEYYTGLILNNQVLGLKFYWNDSSLSLSIYSENKLPQKFITLIVAEVNYRFGLLDDYSSFYNSFKNDKFLKAVIKNNFGRHLSTNYSLYEHLVVSALLQNTTVKRTIQMCHSLLENFGNRIFFDSISLFTLWDLYKFNVEENELRDFKIGYRAKIISRITIELKKEKYSEERLRDLNTSLLVKELLSIYGVGKQTVFYVVINQFHRTDFLKHIPLWERKVLSKYLFNKQIVDEEKIIRWFQKKYGPQCGYAFSMIWEDIFHQHSVKPFSWLLDIMKEKKLPALE